MSQIKLSSSTIETWHPSYNATGLKFPLQMEFFLIGKHFYTLWLPQHFSYFTQLHWLYAHIHRHYSFACFFCLFFLFWSHSAYDFHLLKASIYDLFLYWVFFFFEWLRHIERFQVFSKWLLTLPLLHSRDSSLLNWSCLVTSRFYFPIVGII